MKKDEFIKSFSEILFKYEIKEIKEMKSDTIYFSGISLTRTPKEL